jgi:hypothetical protein
MRYVLALAALAALYCGPARGPFGVAGSCIPDDTQILAEVNLKQLRASTLYQNLPSWAKQASNDDDLLVAFNGTDLLMISRGRTGPPPAGWTQVEPGLAVSGSDSAVRAALMQHERKSRGPEALLRQATAIAGGKPVWVFIRGGTLLPLTGNASNLQPLLRGADYAAITATLSPPAQVAAAIRARNADDAVRIQKTLDAFVMLASMGSDPELDSTLKTIQIRRDGLTVEVTVPVAGDRLSYLLGLFGH